MIASLTLRKGLLLAVAAAGLVACGGDMDDLDSYVNSDEIRAEFDLTDRSDGRPRRVTCQGGRMRFFQFDKEDDPAATPALVSAKSTGPIEVLRDAAFIVAIGRVGRATLYMGI